MRDRTKNYARPYGSIGDQLKQFNEARKEEFGKAPHRNERLPMTFTMVGGDIPENAVES